jgi:hypothetical protein
MHGHAAAKPTVNEILDSRERLNRASADFLKIDVDTALTFLHIARQATDKIRQQRNCRAARRAYETVTRLMQKVRLSEDDAQILTHGLEQLRRELEGMGEEF